MDPKLLQVGTDAESLARYIRDNGNGADREIIRKQVELIVMHSQDLKKNA